MRLQVWMQGRLRAPARWARPRAGGLREQSIEPLPSVRTMGGILDRRELSRAWTALEVTLQEGRHQPQTLSSTEMKVEERDSCPRLPTPG